MGTKIKKFIKKIRIKRTTVLALVFVLMSAILIKQIFELQIIEGQNYISKFESRTTKTRVLKSTRGNIFDRDGELIAWNVLSYSLTFEDNGSYTSTREKNLTLNGTVYQVLKILEKNGDDISHSFHIKLNKENNYVFDVSEGFTLSRFKADIFGYPLIDSMKEHEKNATAEEMMEHLIGSKGFSIVLTGENAYTKEELLSHNLPEELSKKDILDICIVRYLLSTNSFKKYMPVTIATNVSEESVASIMENKHNLQGIEVLEDSVREYVDDESMGPILGYTGKASAEELEALREQNPNYANDAVIGKAGIEQYMELTLQGTDGQETVYVDNLGKVLRIDENNTVDPVAGNDVHLTIDTEWQSAVYQILKQRVAGILMSKIVPSKEFDYSTITDASQIYIPVYDVYNALIENGVIDINDFDDKKASDIEKNLYAKFQQKQQNIFDKITNRLESSDAIAYQDESEQMQEYLSYICDDLLRDTLGIISKDRIDSADSVYKAWANEGSISLRDYLTYATGQNWINISKIAPEGEYFDSSEVYESLSAYIIDYLKTDTNFSKLLYKYMLFEDTISGQELCLCLYEQKILSKKDSSYESLQNGTLSAYDFILNKVANLEIEPAQLALKPCSASAVITDVNTGEVLACVSYPGYDNNRLTNNMDTEYYSQLALDLSSPFYNKATQQKTAPGSTFKILSTVIGWEEHIIDSETYIECTGEFDLVTPSIHCWNHYGHGHIEIKNAIEQSCNYFFNTIGFQAGKNGDDSFSESQSLSIMDKYVKEFCLDQNTGIEISEASPQVSDTSAVRSYMGQGTHLYTTSQLARYASTIANSGTVYNLTLLDSVTAPDGDIIEEYKPEVANHVELSQELWDSIHEGMYRVVETHDQFDDLPMDVAGKTGTAQINLYQPDHGLFIGYAPAETPEYAISVRIANGYSSGNACLAANDIFKYMFELADPETILTGYASSDVSNTSND